MANEEQTALPHIQKLVEQMNSHILGQAQVCERNEVAHEDLDALLHDCLRHRIMLSEAAEREKITTDMVIDKLLEVQS